MAEFANSISAPARRTFLSGLAALPLIGGSIALIGRPTAAATRITPDLMLRYVSFLAHEHREALLQYLTSAPGVAGRDLYTRRNVPMNWIPDDPQAHDLVQMVAPARRAAVVLAAAGLSPIGRPDV